MDQYYDDTEGKDKEEALEIEIDNFLSTWWVKNILTENQNSTENNYNNCNTQNTALAVNVFLFLKWLIERISTKQDASNKIIIIIRNTLHLDYISALAVEIKKIMTSYSYKPELKEKLSKYEIFTDKVWPARWFRHIYWKSYAIPSKMWKLQQVELLDLSGKDELNLVHNVVPQEISRLNDLRYLCLKGQDLKTLPQSLGFCKKLEVLDVRHNKFTEFPLFLKDMPKLKLLKRAGNQLTWTNLYYELRTIKKYPEENDGEFEGTTAQKSKPTRVSTLLNISFDVKCKQKLLSFEEIDGFNLPLVLKNLFYTYNGRGCWEYCYHCKKGLDKECEGYICKLFLQEGFVGLTNVPVFCYACNDCFDEVSTMLRACNKPVDELVPVYENEDVSIKRLHKKNCEICRGKKESQREPTNEDIVHRRLHKENCESCRNNRRRNWRKLMCF